MKHHAPKTRPNTGAEYTISLALKIMLPVLLVFVASSVLLFALYAERVRQQGMDNLNNQLETFASSKAAELTDPLWNFQDDLLHRLMNSYRDNRDLHSVTLYDGEGHELFHVLSNDPEPHGQILTTEKAITHTIGDEVFTLGNLVVSYHDVNLMTGIRERRQTDGLILVILIFVVGGTTWVFLNFKVGRPLRRLQQSLRENANSDVRMPLTWHSRDELGAVVAEYNAMLREVEQQTRDLISANKSLNAEIAQRRKAEQCLAFAHEELERKVKLRTMELGQANEELLELDRQRSAFLSSASHELRTPLAAVLGFAALIKKNFSRHFMPNIDDLCLRRRGETMLQNLEIIRKEGDRLTRLIDDLLDLNKIESGEMQWRDTLLNVEDEVNRSATIIASSFEAKRNVALEVAIGDDIPPLLCDPDRLQQLMINMLSNAFKHTEAGHIRIGVFIAESSLTIQVADTGCGIPVGDQELIFKKFFQSGHGDTNKPAGTGLGLPICKNIVEHYGGTIAVDSTLGRGSIFTIRLPLMVLDGTGIIAAACL